MDAVALGLRSVAHRERKLGHPELAGVIDGAADHIEEAAAKIASDAATIARLERDIAEWKTAYLAMNAKFLHLNDADAENTSLRSRLLTIKKDTVEECAKRLELLAKISSLSVVSDGYQRAAEATRSLATPSVPGTPDIGTTTASLLGDISTGDQRAEIAEK